MRRNEWAYKDGNWRETREPATEEVEEIDGETKKLGFGEYAEYTYVEILAHNPKYLEFVIEEGGRGQPGSKGPPE